jgi:sterol desaturase/sphingolipid hydroxylase (fatty acid hydroxylase superfamily)
VKALNGAAAAPFCYRRRAMALFRLALALAGFLAAAVGLRVLAMVLEGKDIAPLLSWQALLAQVLTVNMMTAVAMLAAGLVIELCIVGWPRSALRRLVVDSTNGTPHADLVFLFMALTGCQAALVSVMTFGLWDRLNAVFETATPLGPLASLPTWQAAPLLFLALTFGNYWGHRLMHTRLLWHVHSIHHAAPDFTLANAARTGLTDLLIVALFQGTIAAVLGGSADAVYWALLLTSFESLYTHSNLRGLSWLEWFGLFTPKAHRIHHAIDPRYHNSNFGDLICLWDKIFGTYIPSADKPEDIAIGVDDPHGIHAVRNPMRAYFLPHWHAVKATAETLLAAVPRQAASRR